jgi:hypothetical protein
MKKRSDLIGMIIIPLSLILLVAFTMQGCKKENGEEYDMVFYWTPAGSSMQLGPMIETYTFHCLDKSTLGCYTFSFQDKPDESGNWMGYPEDGGTCSNFIAVVNGSDGAVFTFIGTLVVPLAEGGIRATGTYDKEVDGSIDETGTFTARADIISGDISPVCR